MYRKSTRYGQKWAVLIAIGVVCGVAPAAQAFYWLGMPGSGVDQSPSLIPRVTATTSTTKPTSPWNPTTPTNTTNSTNPTTPTNIVDPPKDVPEPATFISAIVGVSALAAGKLSRRRKRKKEPQLELQSVEIMVRLEHICASYRRPGITSRG